MNKEQLDKYKNNPDWAETIRLYSGLFNTQNETEDFIIELSDKDVLLATECSLYQVIKNEKTEVLLKEKLRKIKKNTHEQVNAAIALKCYSELSASRKTLTLINRSTQKLDNYAIIQICDYYVQSQLKGKAIIHKKDLRQILILIEGIHSQSVNRDGYLFIDLLINNVYSYLTQPQKLGVDVVIRVFNILKKFDYKVNDYILKTKSFLKKKKSKKKSKILLVFENQI